MHARTVALYCCVAWAVLVSSAPTATPTPTFDNTQINVSYVDVVTNYVVQDLFTGPDQRYWAFLQRMATGLASAGVSVAPQSSLAPGSVVPTRATATIALRRFSVGQFAIPYQRYDQYLVTVVHNGTRQNLYNLLQAINKGALVASLGVTSAYYVPDINAIYSSATVTGNGSDGQLSLAWHILLVVGVTMVYVIALAAKFRQHTSKFAGKTLDQMGSADETVEMHAKRWHTEDLKEAQTALLQRASINSRNKSTARSKWFTDDDKSAFVTDTQLAKCEAALQEVARNDALAVAAGTTTLDADDDYPAHREGSGGRDEDEAVALINQRKRINDSWSIGRINTLLETEPSLRLPPASGNAAFGKSAAATAPKNSRGIILGSKARARQQRLEEEERRQQEAAQKRAQEEAGADSGVDLSVEQELSFDLPPDEIARLEQEREAEESQKQIREARPLGLAARRLARMMTTMAMDPSTVDPSFTLTSVHRSYSLGFNVPSQSPMAHRRSLRAAKFVPQDTVTVRTSNVPMEDGYGTNDSDHSPSQSPVHTPSPERLKSDGPPPSDAPLAVVVTAPSSPNALPSALRNTTSSKPTEKAVRVAFDDDDL